jgi:hypothetical protein
MIIDEKFMNVYIVSDRNIYQRWTLRDIKYQQYTGTLQDDHHLMYCSERLGRALVGWNIENFLVTDYVILVNRKDDATSWNGYTCGSLSSSSQIHVNYHLAISLRLGVRRADMVWF